MGNSVLDRVYEKKVESNKSWDEIATEAGIRLSTWMTGIRTCKPTDSELRKLAPVLNTTYKYLKYGKD